MKKIFVLAAALTTTVAATAQQVNERIVIKAGENLANAISPTGYYRFEKFTQGNFELKNGTKSTANFNYHIASGELQYLTTKGDTLAIAEPEDLAYVNIGGATEYIYANKSYHEIVQSAGPGKLAKRIKIHMENDRKGGYGESAPASSQAQLTNFTMGWSMFQLTYDVAVLKTTSYNWVDSKKNLVPATKKNALKLLPKDKQPKLEAYIEENKTNFNNEDDLRKLLAHAGTL